jgi:hypothetical protein
MVVSPASAKLLRSGAGIAAVALALAARNAPAEAGTDGCGDCKVCDAVYSVSGNLQLSDTPMGAGNGTYAVGPGKVVLRFDPRAGSVKLLAYEMSERFGVEAKKIFWKTRVDTDATARATPTGACGHAAEGAMQGRTLVWSTKIEGLRTDGTLDCKGSMCGKFGAPPPGTSPLHVGPEPVQLQPFEFSADGKTFTMPSAFLSKTESPKQTAHLAISGREVSRSCAPVDACR